MYNDLKTIHIGKLIETHLKASGLSYAHFARLLNVDRTTVYSILRSKSIDIERLIKISQLLNYDFIRLVYLETPPTGTIPILNISESQLCEIREYGCLLIQLDTQK